MNLKIKKKGKKVKNEINNTICSALARKPPLYN